MRLYMYQYFNAYHILSRYTNKQFIYREKGEKMLQGLMESFDGIMPEGWCAWIG